MAPVLIGLLAVGLLADHAAQQAFEEQLSQRLVAIANAEQASLSGYFTELVARVDASDERSLNNLRNRIASIAEATGVRRVFIFRPDLTSVVDTAEGIEFGHRYYELDADANELERVFEGESQSSVLYFSEDGVPFKYAYAPLIHPETGEIVAAVGVEGSSNQVEALSDLRRNTLLLGVVAVLLLVGTSIWVSRRLTAAVGALAEAAQRIGQGDLEQPVPETRSDELGSLEHAVEHMRQNLLSREEEMQMMLSGIAHEVRNPLGGIELFLGLLREDLEAADVGQEQLEQVRKIGRELDYLSRVVQEFLDFARRSRVDVSRFSARALVSEVEQVMSGDLLGRGVTLECAVADTDLTADRDRLKRVLVNLVKNAIQASEAGDTVSLRVTETEDTRVVEVTDEGGGIPATQLADIFRPFFTTREKGTGLGLPMTRKIAEAHGGTVEVTSTEGEGTTVVLTLPFHGGLEPARTTIDIPEGWLG